MRHWLVASEGQNPPTLEVASVKLLSVVLLPADGLPTRPIRGSRGILQSTESGQGRGASGGAQVTRQGWEMPRPTRVRGLEITTNAVPDVVLQSQDSVCVYRYGCSSAILELVGVHNQAAKRVCRSGIVSQAFALVHNCHPSIIARSVRGAQKKKFWAWWGRSAYRPGPPKNKGRAMHFARQRDCGNGWL